VVSAGFPVLVGHMSANMSLGVAIGIDAAIAYSIVVVAVLMLPETRGRTLADDLPEPEIIVPLPRAHRR
jgi:hypothetical protein